MAFDRGDAHFVGGVAYQLVAAPPSVVMQALADVGSLPALLPRTRSARLVGQSGSRARVELVQGNSLVQARYTVVVDRRDAGEIRFRLDKSRAHDIDDVWGWFRAEPFGDGRTLVTVAVALDLGPGLARMLFEERIQRVILSTPGHIKAFVEPMALASARALSWIPRRTGPAANGPTGAPSAEARAAGYPG